MNELTNNEIRALIADHAQALEFVREIAAWETCPIECGNCIVCRARAWLHTPTERTQPLYPVSPGRPWEVDGE